MSRFTVLQKMDAAKRQVNLLRLQTPNKVKAGKITQAEADFQIAVMNEIAEEYRAQSSAPQVPNG